jgi:hypothetical protein
VKRFLILLILSTTSAFADDLCEYFKYCGGASSSSHKSVNTSTSTLLNPSNIARIKGLGVETLLQPNNPLGFSLVTGTGRVGGAIISPTLENSFFGIRSLELDDAFLDRYIKSQRYKNKKLNLAVGINIFDKGPYSFDLGFSAKRNPEVRKINPGAGFSLKLGIFNLGAYIFKDDVHLNFTNFSNIYSNNSYVNQFNAETYQETYLVKSFSAGVRIKNLSLDAAVLSTKYKFYNSDTNIKIYSLAYNWGNFMFNLAHRLETSPNAAIVDNQLVWEENKTFNYAGIQFMANKNLMLGLGYNTFLMNELSGTITIFLN